MSLLATIPDSADFDISKWLDVGWPISLDEHQKEF